VREGDRDREGAIEWERVNKREVGDKDRWLIGWWRERVGFGRKRVGLGWVEEGGIVR